MNVPRGPQIRKAIKATVREIELSLKEVNARAAQVMQKGHYAAAQELLVQAQKIQAFRAEVKALPVRLKALRGGDGGGCKKQSGSGEQRALWEYYQPVLKTLDALGGEARRSDIEAKFAELFDRWLLEGDRTAMGQGKARWKVMIARSRKALRSEGFIEDVNMFTWGITKEGRKIAAQEPKQSRKQ